MKGTRIAAALALVASLSLVVPATAGQKVKSKVKIQKIDAGGAKGKLVSKEPKCEKRRKVALKWTGEYTPVRIAKDKTNKKGRWKIDKAITHRGFFYVTTAPVKRGKIKCRGAESKSIRFR